LSSLYSLTYIQNWNTVRYVNATTGISSGTTSSLGESIQESQQDLQRTIENQVQQTFTDTINSRNQGQGNTTTTTTVDTESIQNDTIIAKILAKSLENYIQNTGAVLNIISQLPQVREVPLMEVLNQTLTTLH